MPHTKRTHWPSVRFVTADGETRKAKVSLTYLASREGNKVERFAKALGAWLLSLPKGAQVKETDIVQFGKAYDLPGMPQYFGRSYLIYAFGGSQWDYVKVWIEFANR